MTMKTISIKQLGLGLTAGLSVIFLAITPAVAVTSSSTTSTGSTKSASNQARLQEIINRGNSEIDRRLTILNALSSKISSATKLSTTDQATLANDVSSEISGLTSLKTTLDGETQVANAITDAQSIFSDYRVFALVVPKVDLIKTADDQQVTEAKLSDLATKIGSDITADQNTGKNVTNLQTQLSALNSKISAAQTISSSIESSVINLSPSDYNSNHSVLSGDRDQLKTAQDNIVTAITDTKNLVSELKSV